MESNKQQLGQFFTTNSDFILSGFEHFIQGKYVCDPFAGNGDLLDWASRNGSMFSTGYDIDIKSYTTNNNNSLLNPPEASFYLTNPPYLASNKHKGDKSIFLGYEDLYQAAISTSLHTTEGIFIVPVNFLSSENAEKVRNVFFERFTIDKIKYFSRQVFDDTKYNVIAIHYKVKENEATSMDISIEMVFEKDYLNVVLEKEYGWRIGGRDMSPIMMSNNRLGIKRLHIDDIDNGNKKIKYCKNDMKDKKVKSVSDKHYDLISNNKIVLFSIDGMSEDNKIRLENIDNYDIDALYSIDTSRNCIQLIFENTMDIEKQNKIIATFNTLFNEHRKKYCSLFLTNFRENDRKKVGFDFVYKFINYIVQEKLYER